MLAFVPPASRAPQPGEPEPPRGSAAGIVLAIILTVIGMLLPWVRHAPAPASLSPGPIIAAP